MSHRFYAMGSPLLQRIRSGPTVFPWGKRFSQHIQMVIGKATKKLTEIHREIMVVKMGDREITIPIMFSRWPLDEAVD